jgi:hypothetical protein
VDFPTVQSYGPALNDDGGGWYVMFNKQPQTMSSNIFFRFAIERTDSDINIWFWPRWSLFVPFEVVESSNTVNPLTWVCEFNLNLSFDNSIR